MATPTSSDWQHPWLRLELATRRIIGQRLTHGATEAVDRALAVVMTEREADRAGRLVQLMLASVTAALGRLLPPAAPSRCLASAGCVSGGANRPASMLVIVALAALLGQSGAVLAADTIEFANGELASGTFKQASPAGVMIEIGGHDVVFPLDKVKAIHFGRPPAAAAAPAPSTQVPATLSTSAPVSAPPAPASTPVDVAGKWVGEWFSFGISRYAEMSLWQEAEKITGTLELRQASNFGYVPKKLTGTLTGGQLTLTVPADRCLFNAELLFTTAAAEDRLEGPSECAGNSQTLRFSRRKRP